MSSLKALIFDVDGTLAETERDGHRVAFNLAFEQFELPWRWSAAEYGELLTIAGGKERLRYYIETSQPDFTPPQTLAQFIVVLHGAKSLHYQQLLRKGAIRPRPGIVRLLNEARAAGLRLAIATTSSLPNTLALLKSAIAPESMHWFKVIAAGDIVANKKPAPDIYQYVLTRLALKPENCWVFEDSEHGLMAAQQTGLPVIVTTHQYTAQQNFKEAKIILNHLGDEHQPCTVIANKIDPSAGLQLLNIPTLQRLSNLTKF